VESSEKWNAIKAMPKLTATVVAQRKLVKEEKQVLYESVAAAEFDSDDDMPKNERKKPLRKAVDRRIERHCEKKKQREEDPDALLSSQDTCATDISNFLQAQQDLAKVKAIYDSTNRAASVPGHALVHLPLLELVLHEYLLQAKFTAIFFMLHNMFTTNDYP
jgi:hypothetical protein